MAVLDNQSSPDLPATSDRHRPQDFTSVSRIALQHCRATDHQDTQPITDLKVHRGKQFGRKVDHDIPIPITGVLAFHD